MSADEKSQGSTALGLGHMADVPVAAFDPIFWLHHWCVKAPSIFLYSHVN